MTQAEKTKKTYNKILISAIEEFGEKGYDNTSLNGICQKRGISKGLIYHNFKNKDELYLKAVEECFVKLTEYLKNTEYQKGTPLLNMKALISLRQEFFKKYPHYRNIFFGAVLAPPDRLSAEIQNIRKSYDDFNTENFKELLRGVKLRKGITEEDAISYFSAYQEMFNRYFQSKIKSGDLSAVGEEHDLKLAPILDVMLYGIAYEEEGL